MRHAALVSLFLIILVPNAGHTQAWQEFVSAEDRFRVYFPDEPMVEEITYMIEDGVTIPARRWSVQLADAYYAVTTVDFADHYPAHDTIVQGSMAHAATNIRRMTRLTEDITHDSYARYDRIPSHLLNINKPDGDRLYALIILHQDEVLDARRLYIVEAHVPESAPPPGLYQQSFEVLDPSGQALRYEPDGRTRQD
jgi:hypothetical protein